MKTLAYLLLIGLLVCVGLAPCTAQQATGPRTLENLLSPDAVEKPTAVPEEGAPQAGPKRRAGTRVRPRSGVQHPDLDKAWAAYDAAVTKATEDVKAVITSQFDAATAKGDLDGALRWQAALEKFEEDGTIPSEGEIQAIVQAAIAERKQAEDSLTTAYEAVVKALTMEKKVVEARAVKNEQDALDSAPGPLKWEAKTIRGNWNVDGKRITNQRQNQELWPELAIEILGLPAHSEGFEFTCSVTLSNSDWGQRMQVEMPGRRKADLGFGGKSEGRKPMDELLAGRRQQPPCFLTPGKKYAFRCVATREKLSTWIDGKPYCVLPMIDNQDPSAKRQTNPVVRLNFSWSVAEIRDFTVKPLSGEVAAP